MSYVSTVILYLTDSTFHTSHTLSITLAHTYTFGFHWFSLLPPLNASAMATFTQTLPSHENIKRLPYVLITIVGLVGRCLGWPSRKVLLELGEWLKMTFGFFLLSFIIHSSYLFDIIFKTSEVSTRHCIIACSSTTCQGMRIVIKILVGDDGSRLAGEKL